MIQDSIVQLAWLEEVFPVVPVPVVSCVRTDDGPGKIPTAARRTVQILSLFSTTLARSRRTEATVLDSHDENKAFLVAVAARRQTRDVVAVTCHDFDRMAVETWLRYDGQEAA